MKNSQEDLDRALVTDKPMDAIKRKDRVASVEEKGEKEGLPPCLDFSLSQARIEKKDSQDHEHPLEPLANAGYTNSFL